MEIIVKRYEHVNRSFRNWDTPKGKFIGSKKQYIEEMKKGGFVDSETGNRIAEQKLKKCEYKGLSSEAESVIKAARQMKDRKGNIKIGSRLIDGMKKVGVSFNVPDWVKNG